MKGSIRYISIILLTAVYCFAINVVVKSNIYSDFQNHPASAQEKIFSDFSEGLLCHTLQSKISVNNINNFPVPNFKNSFTGFSLILKTTKQLLNTRFSRNITFCIDFLINHRKSVIIFPFHYFW